ncbi:MAG TPA: FG-GAP-like repeat-containing protein [Lacunisphaera sp.]|jgi:Tfp pilus assembly protein PilF|nr:FG-GAP-like repeat-containing protein [Lacunisphaera sp.]
MSKRVIWIVGVVLAVAATGLWLRSRATADRFVPLVSRGNGFLEKGDAAAALAAYTEALRLSPASTDVRLNLANAYLLAGQPADAARMCRETLDLDHNSAAAYYLLGCALLRQNEPGPAAEALQQSWKIDRAVPALDFQMGMAQAQLGQVNDAIRDFEGVIRAVPDHPSAHFQLSRLYQQVGRDAEAARELQEHQKILARSPGQAPGPGALEKCKYTAPLAPFVLAQPERRGIPVKFTDATATAFGAAAADFRGPLAVVDQSHDGHPGLFVAEGDKGFRLLDNQAGHFSPAGRTLPGKPGAVYEAALAGDLDNDGFDDVVMLGPEDSRVFKFYGQGRIRDATRAAGLEGVQARSGLLADLDFTGNLDLVVVRPDGAGLGVYRNLGNLLFDGHAPDSGLPTQLPQLSQVLTEDWTNEGLPGAFISRADQPPAFYAKQRAATFAASQLTTAGWPVGTLLATGDFNNDLRPDAVIATGNALEIVFNGQTERARLPLAGLHLQGLLTVDYDNDGWLDLIGWGDNGVRAWRNAGRRGFSDTTSDLGLDRLGAAGAIVAADFDGDGDTDLVAATAGGLRFWRNDGGNRNRQLKLRLAGKRSNASALGVRVELIAGNWRTSRTVRGQPIEIGVGDHRQLDALKLHWFDLSTALVDVPVGSQLLAIDEPTLPSGSCPYLYAWDGQAFNFVTDILGSAPLGLPMSATRSIEADPEEFLALGDEKKFPARDGAYEVRVTDELREVLYLDEASLVVVDHPPGTLVYPTSKMHPGRPFPPHELWTLRPLGVPRAAQRSDGLDVTAALAEADGRMASPVALRRPQLRGLAEPFSVTLDFGPLPADRPLVLALTGWLHFGGGMSNIGASIDPSLPFPFPQLEAQLPDGSWQKVDVDVGTPSGKTKTILVDLEKRLPDGTQRLRLSTAFEIHWDRALLCEKTAPEGSRQVALAPDRADLHWRGFSRYADLPASRPLTPIYGVVSATPPWDRTPAGWVTRYGDVRELVTGRDDRLALLNGGDELALAFDAARLPPKPAGLVRDFYLHVDGWDKDADFHVKTGWDVGPLPFHGMDDQAYGSEPRPSRLDDAWITRYNTRWVGPVVVSPDGKLPANP